VTLSADTIAGRSNRAVTDRSIRPRRQAAWPPRNVVGQSGTGPPLGPTGRSGHEERVRDGRASRSRFVIRPGGPAITRWGNSRPVRTPHVLLTRRAIALPGRDGRYISADNDAA